ncbi:MAG TPA: hypothetical protein DCY07_04420 [Rhodospirillaceae bacterium]|nr:hypothetical protein [Rhodospirillaceae bacterium]
MAFIYSPPEWLAQEKKPQWDELHVVVRQDISAALKSEILSAEPTGDGYSPKPSFFLTLADGRELFIKGERPDATARSQHLFALEVLGNKELRALAPFRPRFITDIKTQGWHFLVHEKIQNAIHPMPWTSEKLTALFQAFCGVYSCFSSRSDAPSWVEEAKASKEGGIGDLYRGVSVWENLNLPDTDPAKRFYKEKLFAAFTNPEDAAAWFTLALPSLMAHEQRTGDIKSFSNLLHLDLRQDNLLFQKNEKAGLRAYVLDWGHLYWGPVVIDIVRLIKNIYSEGGPNPQETLSLFSTTTGIDFPKDDVRVGLSAITGQMALSLVEEFTHEEARCNWVQRLQAIAGLKWWAMEMGLPPVPELAPLPRPTISRPVYIPEKARPA